MPHLRTGAPDVTWRNDIAREGFFVDKKGSQARPGDRPGLGIEIDVGDLNKHHGHPTAELIAMQMIAMEGKQTGGKQTGSGLGVWG